MRLLAILKSLLAICLTIGLLALSSTSGQRNDPAEYDTSRNRRDRPPCDARRRHGVGERATECGGGNRDDPSIALLRRVGTGSDREHSLPVGMGGLRFQSDHQSASQPDATKCAESRFRDDHAGLCQPREHTGR